MARLTKQQVLAAPDLNTKMVDMSKWWGGDVEIQVMSAKQGIDFHARIKSSQKDTDIIFFLLIACCIDENRNPMFTQEDLDDLGRKNFDALEHLFNECLMLNKLAKENSTEEQAKNS